jgi:hypothetical protein
MDDRSYSMVSFCLLLKSRLITPAILSFMASEFFYTVLKLFC